MADLRLVWTVDGRIEPKTGIVPVHKLDRDYVPIRFYARREAVGGSLDQIALMDINDDAVSIFTNRPGFHPAASEVEDEQIATNVGVIAKDSVVTFDVDVGGGEDLTVYLDLDEA